MREVMNAKKRLLRRSTYNDVTMTSYREKLSSFFEKFITNKYFLIVTQPLISTILLTKVGNYKTFTSPLIDWDSVKVTDQQSNETGRLIRETTRIRIRDDGSYRLSHVWVSLLTDVRHRKMTGADQRPKR